LFPETYSFNIGVTPTEILAKMVETCVGVLEELNVPRERWLEVVTTASLLEKESKLSSDRPKVARVIQNRLAKGMKLQFDSTVVYGVGRFDANVYTSQAERDDPNPWNTYYVDGLPAGAICNPGKETLDAAMNPAAGEWLYFCAHNLETGETDFGVTAEDHARCVQKLRQWEAEHS
jgi:UPF0755 protein